MSDDLDFGPTVKGFQSGQRVFGRYTLQKILGRGGMGVVWLAQDEKLEREVALKFLPETLTVDPEGVADLKRETRRALSLTHPRIVRIYDFIQDDRAAAISMEYVNGESLAQLKLTQPHGHFETTDLQLWKEQLGEALSYAHDEAGVVHRDLKPANLMVDGQGNLKIADFGIAATLSDTATRVSKAAGSSGTPVYMSPQQMLGKKPAVTDDVYALGATLHELLAGKPPFYSGNIELQVMQVEAVSVAARREELEVAGEPVAPEWEETIAACLAKEAEARPQSVREVAGRLLGHSAESPENSSIEEGGYGRKEAQEAQKLRNEGGATAKTAKSKDGRSGRSRMPLVVLAFAASAVLGFAGWWLGVEQPQRQAAELEAFRREQGEMAARDAEAQAEALRLANARGSISVETIPAGAEVRVGGVGLNASPARFDELRLGDYEATISLPGYEPQTVSYTVEENRDASRSPIQLVPSVGSLQVTSELEHTRFVLQSRSLDAANLAPIKRDGNLPVEISELPVGAYALTAEVFGWKPITRELRVERGREQDVAFTFPSGVAQFVSQPAGVGYEIKGGPTGRVSLRGNTPRSHRLPVGDYTVTFTKEGWPEQRRSVKVAEGGQASFAASFVGGNLRLETEPAGVAFNVTPGAGVTRGREFSYFEGTTPHVFEDLPTGEYSVRFEKPGWEPERRVVQVSAEGESAVAVSFAEGDLAVTSVPAGMEFSVRSKVTNEAGGWLRAPQNLSLPSGDYVVTMRRGEWPQDVRSVTVLPNGQVSFAGDFQPARAKFVSEPAGAEVWLGDRRLGTTPLVVDQIVPGPKTFEFRLARHASLKVTRTFVAGRESRVAARMEWDMPREGSVWTIPEVGIEILRVNSGQFVMGKATRVTLSEPYWLGKTEVTQGQWEAVMGRNPSKLNTLGQNGPVTNMNWPAAMSFCKKITAREREAGRLPVGYEYALPTEAQWEFAARAGGSDDGRSTPSRANPNDGPTVVGQGSPNSWGFLDMDGNVSELCFDWHSTLESGQFIDPIVVSQWGNGGMGKVVRGYPSSRYGSPLIVRGGIGLLRGDTGMGFRLALRRVE